MGNPTDDAVAQLETEWPNWQFWVVRQFVGGTVFCARRHDDHQRVLNAGSAAELTEMLEAEVTP